RGVDVLGVELADAVAEAAPELAPPVVRVAAAARQQRVERGRAAGEDSAVAVEPAALEVAQPLPVPECVRYPVEDQRPPRARHVHGGGMRAEVRYVRPDVVAVEDRDARKVRRSYRRLDRRQVRGRVVRE